MKKKIVSILMLFLLVGMLSACGPKNPKDAVEDSAQQTEETTIPAASEENITEPETDATEKADKDEPQDENTETSESEQESNNAGEIQKTETQDNAGSIIPADTEQEPNPPFEGDTFSGGDLDPEEWD